MEPTTAQPQTQEIQNSQLSGLLANHQSPLETTGWAIEAVFAITYVAATFCKPEISAKAKRDAKKS